jgi:hypothetical protein
MHVIARKVRFFKAKPTALILISLCAVIVFTLVLTPDPCKAGGDYTSTVVFPYEYHREYTLPAADPEVRKNLYKGRYFDDNDFINIIALKNSSAPSPAYIPPASLRDSINCISSLTGTSGIKSRLSYQLLDKPPPYAASPC